MYVIFASYGENDFPSIHKLFFLETRLNLACDFLHAATITGLRATEWGPTTTTTTAIMATRLTWAPGTALAAAATATGKEFTKSDLIMIQKG
jgi:hypothetical protein